jgi:tetratricopeptide (TPR) repeat protein
MKRTILTAAAIALLASHVYAQGQVPAAGLAAEGEGRWADALALYRAETARNQSAADLWLRIADIESRLGKTEAAIEALERAVAVRPSDSATFVRLSRAYAAAGHAAPAARAMEGALALDPTSEDYLRSHATLATWAGEYAAAERSYRTLRKRHPRDTDLTLALARVAVWAGNTDRGVVAYREYLDAVPAASDVWLELARAESWRGNFAAAVGVLDQYRDRFGETEPYARELTATLARGGRPREALRGLDTLLTVSPEDRELLLSRTIALGGVRRHGDAVTTLARVESLRPGDESTRAAERVVRSLLASSIGPASTVYGDSDGLRTFRFAPRFDVGFNSDTRLYAGYEYLDLAARAGSGLDQLSGSTTARVDHAWAGLTQRLGVLTFGGTVGEARSDSDRLTTYSALARVTASDALAFSVERSYGFFAISPRTVGLGLTRLGHRVQFEWLPTLRYYIGVDGTYEQLSDDNARWEVFVAPRLALARTQRLNMDVGVLVHQFGATDNLDNGYYDPNRYEFYSLVLSPYWKVSENVGLGASVGAGVQRDDASRAFRYGGNASAEATFGIYRRWLVKVHGSTTANRRLESGAFRGYSGGVVLLRRF